MAALTSRPRLGLFPDCVSAQGVLDLTGGVHEWCSDWYEEGYYAKSPTENPTGPETGTRRSSRGGGWMSPAQSARAASRLGIEAAGWHGPMQGFRCVQDDQDAAKADGVVAPDLLVSSRIEVRVETVANVDGGGVEPCEVVQESSARSALSFDFWSTLGEGPASPPGVSARQGAGSVRGIAMHCGRGASPAGSLSPPDAVLAPLLIQELSVSVGWDHGTMDPGPVGAVQARARPHLTPTDRVLHGRQTQLRRLGDRPPNHEARAGGGVRPARARGSPRRRNAGRSRGAAAHPRRLGRPCRGDRIRRNRDQRKQRLARRSVLDGGVAGRAATDGSLLLSNVPVGDREVRIRGAQGFLRARRVGSAGPNSSGATRSPRRRRSTSAQVHARRQERRRVFDEYRRLRDGATMVRIPEGEFLMGNLETEGAPLPHTVDVSSFLMDKLPLTVGRYKRFAAATGRPLPPDPYWGVHDDFPVAFVRWDEAKAYCEWAGGRLPTEAEREKATRGTDGRLWPWGSEPPTPERGVFRGGWGQDGNDAVGDPSSGRQPLWPVGYRRKHVGVLRGLVGSRLFRVEPAEGPGGPEDRLGPGGEGRLVGQPAHGAERFEPQFRVHGLSRRGLRIPLRRGRAPLTASGRT